MRSAWTSTWSTGGGSRSASAVATAGSEPPASSARPYEVSAPRPVSPTSSASRRMSSTRSARCPLRRGDRQASWSASAAASSTVPGGRSASTDSTRRRVPGALVRSTSIDSGASARPRSSRCPTSAGSRVIASQDVASRTQRSAASRPSQPSYRSVGSQTGSWLPPTSSRPAARAVSSSAAAVGSSASTTLAVRRSSRTPSPPERSSTGGSSAYASSKVSTSRSRVSTWPAPAASAASVPTSRGVACRAAAAGAGRAARRRGPAARPRGAARPCPSRSRAAGRARAASAPGCPRPRPGPAWWPPAPSRAAARRRAAEAPPAPGRRPGPAGCAACVGSDIASVRIAPAAGCRASGSPSAASTGASWGPVAVLSSAPYGRPSPPACTPTTSRTVPGTCSAPSSPQTSASARSRSTAARTSGSGAAGSRSRTDPYEPAVPDSRVAA